jgi:hypothetical protein
VLFAIEAASNRRGKEHDPILGLSLLQAVSVPNSTRKPIAHHRVEARLLRTGELRCVGIGNDKSACGKAFPTDLRYYGRMTGKPETTGLGKASDHPPRITALDAGFAGHWL